MTTLLRVLLVDDSEDDAELILRQLRSGAYDPRWERVDTPEAMTNSLNREPWDVILCDFKMPRFSAPEALKLVQEREIDIPFIIVSGGIGEDTAVAMMKAGAHDFLMKDNLARLIVAIEREMREARIRREMKRAEEGLRIKDWAIESALNAIAISDLAGNLNYVNPAFLKLWGYSSPAEVLGKSAEGLWQIGEKAAEVIETLRILGGWSGELAALRKDGALFNVNVAASMILDASGSPICMMASFVDITESKRAEEEKRNLLGQLVRAEKLAAVGELIAGVAHEINNPLTGIVGLSELLLRENKENLDEDTKKDLKSIFESSERIKKIVRNLLRFARREAPERKDVSVNELLERVLSIRDYEMKVKNVELKKNYQLDLPLVMADPSQLEQVFLNLITNAEYAIHDNQGKAGTLTIATSVVPDNAGGKTVVIEFSDTGPGIPSDVLPKIFDPFFTTKPVGKGTGLGLSVSYGIVKEHKGEIYGRNRAEGGAVFTIELPVGGGNE